MFKSDGAHISLPRGFFFLEYMLIMVSCNKGKHAYDLTEQEILTLPHETIQNSRKSYYACSDLGALSLRKLNFIDPSFVIPPEDPVRPKPISRGLIKAPRKLMEKTQDGPRRIKSNYEETSVYIAVSRETDVSTSLFLSLSRRSRLMLLRVYLGRQSCASVRCAFPGLQFIHVDD